MRITIICHEIPYPANHGGRVDAWRRIKAFSEFGAEIQLIAWYKKTPQQANLNTIDRYVHAKHLIPFSQSFSSLIYRMIDLIKYPLEVTSRIVRGEKLSQVERAVREFEPDVIWLDHLHGAELAHYLVDQYHLPLITRSHNIEHLYYKRLKTSAADLMSVFKRTLSNRNLRKYEFKNLRKSSLFYDISLEDLRFWQNSGFSNGRYLSPLIDFTAFDRDIKAANNNQKQYDLVFLGNLYSDNNVAGVVWFIQEVLPKIQNRLPDTSVLIAGSQPTKKIREVCQSHSNIELRINPPSTSLIYQSAKILINPTFAGSGVNMKSLEMLLAQKPIVAQPQGMAGLSQELRTYFNIADNADQFAAEIIDLLLGNKQTPVADRSLLESLFGFRAINQVLQDLQTITKKNMVEEALLDHKYH